MSRLLPQTFTSLYRLFLRTSAASVLHQPRAVNSLRKLWRPAFDDAARVTAQLQTESLSAAHRNDLEIWLKTWHLRIDNTLAILYTSCKTRGLSHQLTRNLGLLVRGEQGRINARRLPEWKPQLARDAPQYRDAFRNPEVVADKTRQIDEGHGWDALEEVIRMAEGRNELVFGRISLKRTRYRMRDPTTN
ncbi:hypothetical protein FB451DRAFT_199571 [Mycena latifolia]|nr:hypothetical protein FB451DRAFT_199571 [Mycena latifolia]